MLLADKVNAYVDHHKPWDLAKDAANNEALHQVCSVLINAFAEISRYLAPVLPALAKAVQAFVGTSMEHWTVNGYVASIQPYAHLMQRVTPEQLEAFAVTGSFLKRLEQEKNDGSSTQNTYHYGSAFGPTAGQVTSQGNNQKE